MPEGKKKLGEISTKIKHKKQIFVAAKIAQKSNTKNIIFREKCCKNRTF
jgi:hypothetical protein